MVAATYPTQYPMASLMLLAIGLSLCLIVVTMYAFQLIADSRRRLPPGPLPLPIVGNLLAVGRGNPQRSLARLASRYGPLMSLRLGVVPAVVVSSADAAREIHQRHNADLADRPVLDVWNAHGHRADSVIALPPHAKWRAMRRLCATELFAPSRLNALQPLRQRKVDELLRCVAEEAALGEPVAVREPLFAAAMNIVSGTMFSVDLLGSAGSGSGPGPSSLIRRGFSDDVKEATVLAATPNVSDFFPAIAAADLQGLRRRMAPLVASARQILDELFAQRQLEREREACCDEPPKKDMLDAVLDKEREWQQEGSVVINRSTIKGLFTDMLVAGSDTSSTTVEWAMASLLANPETMEKAKRELKRVVGARAQVQESDIAQLPYLQAVVKEVLRLYPPVAMSFYRAEATVQVQGGYTIPQGTTIILNIWAVHRDADVWPDPHKFMPERFMDDDGNNTIVDFSGKDGKLIPFGGGRRICLGLPLAYRTVHLVLASLLHHFDWTLPQEAVENGIDMTEKFGIVISMATPLKAVAKKRVLAQ